MAVPTSWARRSLNYSCNYIAEPDASDYAFHQVNGDHEIMARLVTYHIEHLYLWGCSKGGIS
jgi:hypothetical protein